MSRRVCIMIVEDERIVARDLELRLLRLGYYVVANVGTAAAAIDAMAASRPDLVLMDIVLRGPMDGIEAAQHIRERSGTPVLYISAHVDERTLQRARQTSPCGYLSKPFSDEELQQALDRAVRECLDREQEVGSA